MYPLDQTRWPWEEMEYLPKLFFNRLSFDGHVTEDPEEAEYFFIPHPIPFSKAESGGTMRILEVRVQCLRSDGMG